jgi:folate-binding protein YgfZ
MLGYLELRTRAAWRDLSGRGRILAHGEDNARLLHAMSSNHINGLEEGQGCYAFFLNAVGRIQGDATIMRCGADFLIDTEAGTHEKLFTHLDLFIIADDVTLEDLAASHFEIGIEGPEAEAIAAGLGVPVPPAQNGILVFEGGYIARLNETGVDGVRLILPVGSRAEWLAKLTGVVEADSEAWEIVRHENGKPRFGVEILEKHLIQETRLMHGVHFTKGCYLGQEIVERVRARGAVHKGLASVTIESGEKLPAQDAELCGGGVRAGHLLSVVHSPAENCSVGFAVLGVEYLGGDKHISCDGLEVRLRPSSVFAAR